LIWDLVWHFSPNGYKNGAAYFFWDPNAPKITITPMPESVVAGRDLLALANQLYDKGQKHGVLPAIAAGEALAAQTFGITLAERPR
jgi:hypothetical protein